MKTVRFTEVVSGATKAEVRAHLKGGELNLTVEQTAKIQKLLRGGSMERVNIKLTQTGDVRVSTERAGRSSGYQRISFEIDRAGKTSKMVQTAFDDTNTLVRQRPGESKNNLYDVKKWKEKTY